MDIIKLGVIVAAALLLVSSGNAQDFQPSPAYSSSDWYLSVEPHSLENIVEYVTHTLNVTLNYNGTKALAADDVFTVAVEMTNQKTLVLSSSSLKFSAQDVLDGVHQNLNVTGQVVGYVHVNFLLEGDGADTEASGDRKEIHPPFFVTVVRSSNVLNKVFTLIVTTLTMINFISMGCGLDLKVVKENILRPVGPVVGFISQFTFMPLVSWFINLEKHQLLTIQFQ